MVHVVMLTCAYYDDSSLKRPNSTKENRWYEEGGQTAQVLTLELDRTSPSMLIPAEKRCCILPPRCKRAEPLEPHHQRYHRLALRSRDSVRERPRRPRLCANDADNLPFFGYKILNSNEPATTLWELWDSDTSDPHIDSRNHIMFGGPGAWFHTYVGGITNAPW